MVGADTKADPEWRVTNRHATLLCICSSCGSAAVM